MSRLTLGLARSVVSMQVRGVLSIVGNLINCQGLPLIYEASKASSLYNDIMPD